VHAQVTALDGDSTEEEGSDSDKKHDTHTLSFIRLVDRTVSCILCIYYVIYTYIYICNMLYIYHYYLLLLSSSLLLYMLLARNLPSPDPGFSQPFNKNRIAGRGFLHHRGVAPPGGLLHSAWCLVPRPQ
jgi:hypothetical protein